MGMGIGMSAAVPVVVHDLLIKHFCFFEYNYEASIPKPITKIKKKCCFINFYISAFEHTNTPFFGS
jgi:hypothetical protein